MAGGQGRVGGDYSSDILMYDGAEDKWTKVGDLCQGRAYHAISLVPAAVDEECILDIDCWMNNVQNKQQKFLFWF